jgi:hypothetical protein
MALHGAMWHKFNPIKKAIKKIVLYSLVDVLVVAVGDQVVVDGAIN